MLLSTTMAAQAIATAVTPIVIAGQLWRRNSGIRKQGQESGISVVGCAKSAGCGAAVLHTLGGARAHADWVCCPHADLGVCAQQLDAGTREPLLRCNTRLPPVRS